MADLIRRSDVIGLLEDMLLFGEYDIIASSFSKADEEKAYRAINDIPAVNRWISVEDALPDALQSVLVCTDINTVTVAWINGDGWTFADTGNGHTENWPFEDVKFWMSLPEPPESEVQNG